MQRTISALIALPLFACSGAKTESVDQDQGIPVEFHGVYDSNSEGCSDLGSEGRLTIFKDRVTIAKWEGGSDLPMVFTNVQFNVEAVEINSRNSITVWSDEAYSNNGWDEILLSEFFGFEIFEGGTRLVMRCVGCHQPNQIIADGEKNYAVEEKILNKVRCREI